MHNERKLSWRLHVLKRREDFLYLQNCGEKISGRYISIFSADPKENSKNSVQFGITVSKKVSNNAIVRNKIKRRIREIFREQVLPGLQSDVWIAINAKASCIDVKFEVLRDEVLRLMKKVCHL